LTDKWDVFHHKGTKALSFEAETLNSFVTPWLRGGFITFASQSG
jgi:hypothetical protein